jgi:prepilin-type N-terminal cleavage/methylation domain-containing protein/prepilin-type processing-associated H-X9-DG protein
MNHPLGRRPGFTLVELLVVIAIIAIIAGLVVPGLMRAQGRAYMVKCSSNLRGLQGAAYDYSQKDFSFPIGRSKNPPAHESLNVLLKSASGSALEPEVFACPQGNAIKPDVVDGVFVLEADNLDYSWVERRTRNTSKVPLSSDKYFLNYQDSDGTHSGHDKRMNVLYTDGSVKEIEMDDELLTEDMLPKGLIR